MSIKTPDEYKKKFESLFNNFNSSLENMAKIYPNYKLDTNKDNYSNNKNKFFSIKNDINKLIHNLSDNVEDSRKEINALNDNINVLDKEHKKLTRELNKLNNLDLAAKGALDDHEVHSRQIYISNIILLLIIVSHIGLYYFGKL